MNTFLNIECEWKTAWGNLKKEFRFRLHGEESEEIFGSECPQDIFSGPALRAKLANYIASNP